VRVRYVGLALITIVVGLIVHWSARGLDAAVRDILGDALWAAMIVWWVGAIAPGARPLARAAGAYGVCVAVELSQLYHSPGIDAVRETTLGGLVLGSGFDRRDLVAYAIGVGVAMLIDAKLRIGRSGRG